jgi:hypothetical protein
MARWRNNETGYIHPKSSVKADDRTPQFLINHSWIVERARIVELANKPSSDRLFVVGLISNYDEISDLFEVTFALDVSNEELVKRLASREDNDWGKSSHELEKTLDRQNYMRDLYKKFDYIVIDSDKPVDHVADEILLRAGL